MDSADEFQGMDTIDGGGRACLSTLEEAALARSVNTQKAYGIGAREFTKFCEDRKYKDGYIVKVSRL
jgi:hypothetical protein